MTDPDAGARAALRLLGPDPANWVPNRDGVDHNVVIVGGGQFGVPIGDVPSMKRGHPAVTAQISRDLFLADFDHHQRRMTGDVAPDFGPELYAKAVWSPPGR
jgi:hypothetical protein